jgi:cystathionine beta-lyase/cystathionine gamma-synthase
LQAHLGVDVQHIDITSPEALQKTLGPGNRFVSLSFGVNYLFLVADIFPTFSHSVKMVLVESPTNPLLKIADIQGISDMVHAGSPVRFLP